MFKLGKGDGLLRAIKIRGTPSFRGEVKLAAPKSSSFYGMEKITCKYEQKYLARQNSSFPSPISPGCYQMTLLVGLPESSGG
jgi:hypothetical protein